MCLSWGIVGRQNALKTVTHPNHIRSYEYCVQNSMAIEILNGKNTKPHTQMEREGGEGVTERAKALNR